MNYEFDRAFRAACAAVGVVDKSVPQDGQWHAADLVDDPRGRGDGRIKLFADGQGGIVWNHKSGERETFFSDWKNYSTLTPEQRRKEQRRRQLQQQVDEQKTRERQEKAGEMAMSSWAAAQIAVTHPYLSQKKIGSHGSRLADWFRWCKDDAGKWRQITVQNALLIPMYNESRSMRNLQAIFPAVCPELGRSKDFLPGGQTKGLFWWVGPKSGEVVCIAEGFATAATVFEQTGYRTYIAFSADNLMPVGQVVRQNLPDAKIIICADNDAKTEGNPGWTKANAAAAAIDGFVAAPPEPGDFNDYLEMLDEATHGR